jgi:flagellar basal-body rod protein FlgG
MMRSVYTAASGMAGQQTNIDTIAHNLANVNTTAFKKMRLNFQDLMYDTQRPAGTTLASGGQVPVGLEVGLGTKIASSQRTMAQGTFQQTSNPTDIAIQGEGFFKVALPDGTLAYTRDGSFQRDSTGALATSDGYKLDPNISIPQEATSIIVSADGKVSVMLPGNAVPSDVGQITLNRFPNPPGLQAMGKDLYVETPASGAATQGNPGTSGFGSVTQGFLEMSNVSVVDEMVNMITAQRAYEINARVIQGADHMLGIVASLKQ